MRIRRLKPKDARIYRSIRLEALKSNPEVFAISYEDEVNQPIEKYANRFKVKDSYTFGAFERSQLVGVVTLIREVPRKLQHRANIVAMYVEPEKRGQGIGKALLSEAIATAKKLHGIEQIYLSVVTTNLAAKRLYVSLGFETFGTEKRALKWENTYFDENHMVLYL